MRGSSDHSDTFFLTPPAGFNFWRTVFSHGWCALPPFSHDTAKKELSCVFATDEGMTAFCTMHASGRRLRVTAHWNTPGGNPPRAEIIRQIRTCFRMDEDFSDFYREARRHPGYRWIPASGAGRMLRAPTMFEDAVKMICTTNCTWALTTLMVSNLVAAAGEAHDGAGHAFPTPAAVARLTESDLRERIKAGYRAPFLLALAERVASGELAIESWRTSALPTEALFEAMREVKGIGPYAAANLLKLSGRYDYLGLDSWVRGRYYELRRGGRRVKDATIERDYAQFGRWRGLFFWLEMTRSWHSDKFDL